MGWQHRLPRGVSNFRETGSGFEAAVEIPIDEDGFFGRECPDCGRFFKVRHDQWEAFPDDVRITCPYCGHQPVDATDFLTRQQHERVMSAAESMAEQFAHQAIQDAFSGMKTRPLRPGQSGVQITVTQSPAPPVRSLTSYVEDQVRKTITCGTCQTAYAVYGATAFCPVCGPRPALDTVVEAIERGRRSLALQDVLPTDLREQARADGVFDKDAADAVKETVTLFEVFARHQFEARVPGSEQILKKHGRGVFQRLADTEALFADHCGMTISSLVAAPTWSQLQVVFQQRHILVHREGIVDEEYLRQVPTARQKVGQRLVLGRHDAEQALDALEAVVRAIATADHPGETESARG